MSRAQDTTHLPREQTPDYTPIGVDIGEWNLAAAAPADGEPETALVISGEDLSDRYAALVEAAHALEDATFDTSTAEAQLVAAVWQNLRAESVDAANQVIQYARQFPVPLLVLEDLGYPKVTLWEHRTADELGTWLLPALQQALADRARDAGLPVAYVDPMNTTQECHTCGALGVVDDQVLVCPREDCPVEATCRDRSAALTIAQRGQPE